ncbi:MAG: CaiB/BaiF CoA transferase family protein [Dehalococcoidia bacterium]
MVEQALSDLIVVDCSQGIAGPYCGKLFADYGARVIKVEPPAGDWSRRAGPFPGDMPDPEKSALFLHLNTAKKGVTLDLTTRSGAIILRKLLERADVLLESEAVGAWAAHGFALDDDALARDFPRLVHGAVTPFGRTGPLRAASGNGYTAFAYGGLMYVTGDPDRPPLATKPDPAGYIAGLNLYTGILAALARREQTGAGGLVETSLVEAVAANNEYGTILYSFQGAVRRRWYSRHPFRYPSDIFPCQDGYVAVVYGRSGLMQLAVLIERPDLLEDSLFTDYRQRIRRWRELDEILAPYLMSHTAREIVEQAQDLHEPFALVPDARQLLDDPHLQARHYFQTIDHGQVGSLRYPGPPFRMSRTPWQSGPAPLLGQHNPAVLGEVAGYDRQDLLILRERGIV